MDNDVTDSLASLKELALVATPGPWIADTGDTVIMQGGEARLRLPTPVETIIPPHFFRKVDAAYIAAANPAVVLKLIEVVEAAQVARSNSWRRVSDLDAIIDALDALMEEPK
jgi:hypothetical protein